jgi:hypothetical protein
MKSIAGLVLAFVAVFFSGFAQEEPAQQLNFSARLGTIEVTANVPYFISCGR